MKLCLWLPAVAVSIAGCVSLLPSRKDAEGFAYFDGQVASEAPSEYFILRFERPNGVYTNKAYYGITNWEFNEVRQLKSGTTLLVDGVLKKGQPKAGRNWQKWVKAYARNVRIKFVDENYTLADDGRDSVPDGFVSLFNGKDLDGWKGVTTEENFNWPGVRRAALPEKLRAMQAKADESMRKHWFVRDGVLFFDGLPGGYSLATARDYGNFELQADWRLLRVYGDTGFYLRGVPQVQIWDPNKWFGLGSCGIWNNEQALSNPRCRADRPIGDWNRCRMKLVGDRLTVWLNGEKVVDNVVYENRRQPGAPLPLIDQIELQCHGDPVEFRNIFIKELPEATADVPDPKTAVRGERIDLLKAGLESWEATDVQARMGWRIENGVLSNQTGIDPRKTGRGGAGTTHLRTKRSDFYDFDLSYDVLVPTKCNSGVYLRGRYEIQVLDSFGRGKTDSHFMGALYSLIEPSVSAEKPAGEWQHVDLTIYRRHLTVTLNGVRIIDNRPIPGVTPGAQDWDETKPGPILLQGDHSNASFKNMFLTKIIR